MDEMTANNKLRIVSVKNFRIDADYTAWFSEIKRRYISAQIKASVKVNTLNLPESSIIMSMPLTNC